MRRLLGAGLTAAALTALLAPAVQAAPARGLQVAAPGVRGSFNLLAMMHTSTAQFPTLPGVVPWDGRRTGGFAYRSIPCTGNAPVNNISSNLPSYNGRVRDSRVPSSTRLHPFTFRAERTRVGLVMVGRITLTVCQLRSGPTPDPDSVPDSRKPKIRIMFRAPVRRENAEHLGFSGTFRITGGTGRYAGLSGAGTIAGYLFCFAPDGCAAGGRYADGQVSLQGTYADPTPQLAAG